MKRIPTWLTFLSLTLSLTFLISVRGQAVPDPSEAIAAENSAPEPEPFTDADLDQLLGPIALYPDPLLAILLPAATHPTQIVLAVRFLNAGGDPNDIESQPWSESVQALAHYPEVIRWMEENLDWTTQVGEAFLRQPEEVMDSIQRLRALAQSFGNLQTTAEQLVETADDAIDIIPTYPDEIYVPAYDPAVVYTRTPNFSTGANVRFRAGMAVGGWLNRDWDWPNRRIVIWTKEHARPLTWWSQPRAERCKFYGELKQWRPQSTTGKYAAKFWHDRGQNHPNRPNSQGANHSRGGNAVHGAATHSAPPQHH
jgi:hypothetical protein